MVTGKLCPSSLASLPILAFLSMAAPACAPMMMGESETADRTLNAVSSSIGVETVVSEGTLEISLPEAGGGGTFNAFGGGAAPGHVGGPQMPLRSATVDLPLPEQYVSAVQNLEFEGRLMPDSLEMSVYSDLLSTGGDLPSVLGPENFQSGVFLQLPEDALAFTDIFRKLSSGLQFEAGLRLGLTRKLSGLTSGFVLPATFSVLGTPKAGLYLMSIVAHFSGQGVSVDIPVRLLINLRQAGNKPMGGYATPNQALDSAEDPL